jgi:hypothetical protein
LNEARLLNPRKRFNSENPPEEFESSQRGLELGKPCFEI